MRKLLKEYLLIKWWFPFLIFGISVLLYINGTILPNTNFGLFTLIISGLILLISSIWQLINGRKIFGIIQLILLVTPLIFLGFIFYLFTEMNDGFSDIMDKPDSQLTIESIEPLIIEKTDLIIPKNFEVLENLIKHTEGSFDSDYSISLKIKYQESDEKNITEQIHKKLSSKTEKGIWKKYESGFDFEHNGNETNRAEPFYLKVDTLSNIIELYVMHL